MSRTSRRQAQVTTAAPAPAPLPASAPEETPKPTLPLGWRLAMGLWVVMFLALFVFELWGFVWKVVRGMF